MDASEKCNDLNFILSTVATATRQWAIKVGNLDFDVDLHENLILISFTI